MRSYKIKINLLIVLLPLFWSVKTAKAQNNILTLPQAIQLALDTSYDAKIADNQVEIAQNQLQVSKNMRYPDFKITGQYDYLTNPKIESELQSGSDDGGEPAAPPEVHNIYFGQAALSLPVFAGGRLRNSVLQSENMLQSAIYQSRSSKEKLALDVVQTYMNLYKARKTVKLMEDNLESARHRVKDFSGMEKNGLLARNDLLKAQLQASNIELALEEAKKTEHILNYQLATYLKLPENDSIELGAADFGKIETTDTSGVITRNDIEALRFQEEAARNGIKIAKAKYYPSLQLVGGYVALNIENVARIENAMNFGVGFSYNLADIFKAKSEVHVAEGRALNVEYNLQKAQEQANIQIKSALEDYKLAIKKYNVYTLSVEQAKENYRIVNNKYKNGLIETRDLLEADIDQLQANINLATAGSNITQKYYELLAAEGRLLPTISK